MTQIYIYWIKSFYSDAIAFEKLKYREYDTIVWYG